MTTGEALYDGNQRGLNRIVSRDLFLYLLDLEVKRARRYQNFLCLLLLNFEESPMVNETNFQSHREIFNNLLMDETRDTDILGSLGEKTLAILLPYADNAAGNHVKARFEGALKYFDSERKGYRVRIDQVCFPVNGTDTSDLIKDAFAGRMS
jgi:hypothetical protein